MACVLAEADRIYGSHGVAFFTLHCSFSDGKKKMRFPAKWQMLAQDKMRFANKNAVCVRTGTSRSTGAQTPLVVVDADGLDAIAVVERLLARTGVDASLVPQVQTQRGESGRHYYFRATGLAATMKSGAKLVVDGAQTNVDVRAGSNGEGVGCVLAPPTKVLGGGEYTLLPGPPIHEAPAMPDALAAVLGARGRSPAAPTAAALAPTACASALCAAALRDAKIRAGTESTDSTTSVGYPSRVVRVDTEGARVEFTHRGTRVCPISRNEHRSNHFSVVVRLDERTGLPAFFVYCHSAKDGCKGAGHRMLGFLCADEADSLCAEAGIDNAQPAQQSASLGQAAVAIGESQKCIDRLLENPTAGWVNVESLSVVACALCTAAGGHAGLTMTAQLMLGDVLDATKLTEGERGLVSRAFQPARTPLDAVATLRGFAAGLHGKREQELMLVREVITACTDPALEADVVNAADAMLIVL